MKIVVKHNQTIWDISTQYTGDSGNAMSILLHNRKKNSVVAVGEIVDIPAAFVSRKYTNFFQNRNIASGLKESELTYMINQDEEFMLTQENEYLLAQNEV